MNLETIYQHVIDGEMDETAESVAKALAAGFSPNDILNKALIAAMDEVGRRYEEGDFFVPEMLIAARAMQSGLHVLKPDLVQSDVGSAGKIVIGTVKGDLHDIGKNLVAMMLEGAGFEVIDLGTDVDPQKFVQCAKDGAQVIGLSALLTTTMSNMAVTIDALKQAGVRDQVKVIVGGAPVTAEFAKQIGADGFAPDASTAARVVRQLLD
jgi:5-methyltetrahydrofolate--homocysteine methyltransferase